MDKRFVYFLAYLVLLAACTAVTNPTQIESENVVTTAVVTPTTQNPTAAPVERSDIERNPRKPVPENINFSVSLGFDAIPPIYNPEFATAADAPLRDEELVMGVAWGGEAKAYPITVLRYREMVNDELDGIPTLVTW